MMKAAEKRKAVADAYKECINRNLYSQDTTRRECAFKPHTDGKYYSDCSSSIRLAYKKVDIGLSYIGGNTAGMYNSTLGSIVDITVVNGVPTNPAQLRVGDILLFAGTNSSRPLCIGHVEMVYSISGSSVTLCGHGSGNPSYKDMATYCKTRYNTKIGTTKGNKGLVCVKRYVQDDDTVPTPAETNETPAANSENVDYVTGLYRELLNREPDAVGLAHWTEELNNGTMSREQVKAGIAESQEYKDKHPDQTISQIRTWVDGYLGRCVEDLKTALCTALQTYLNRTHGSGLAVDGSFGSKTKAACLAVKKGSKGDLVRVCQAKLYSKGYDPKGFDGSCGTSCDAAIRQYQKDHGLTVDGSCGANTFYSLFNK